MIDTQALQHNFQRVRALAPDSRILAVIKANGYGHGLDAVAKALTDTDAFAVGTMQEALELRLLMPEHDIVVLQGLIDAEDVSLCEQHNLQVVIHSEYQLQLLESASLQSPVRCWLKVDTGMHRLGVLPDQVPGLLKRCMQSANIRDTMVVMSHLACADEPTHVENQLQMETFDDLEISGKHDRSLVNSAGLIAFPGARYEWVRPGIMLYGISPLQDTTAQELNLVPAMTLKSRLIAINHLMQGDNIGYGASWQCCGHWLRRRLSSPCTQWHAGADQRKACSRSRSHIDGSCYRGSAYLARCQRW